MYFVIYVNALALSIYFSTECECFEIGSSWGCSLISGLPRGSSTSSWPCHWITIIVAFIIRSTAFTGHRWWPIFSGSPRSFPEFDPGAKKGRNGGIFQIWTYFHLCSPGEASNQKSLFLPPWLKSNSAAFELKSFLGSGKSFLGSLRNLLSTLLTVMIWASCWGEGGVYRSAWWNLVLTKNRFCRINTYIIMSRSPHWIRFEKHRNPLI